jgi:hypothetical protein
VSEHQEVPESILIEIIPHFHPLSPLTLKT